MIRHFCVVVAFFLIQCSYGIAREESAGRVPDTYPLTEDSKPQQGVPQGTLTQAVISSQIYDGREFNYQLYVPAQYDASQPAAVMVFMDGSAYARQGDQASWRTTTVFDNLIHKGELPVMIGVFIDPGSRRTRSEEYDTLSDKYARFVIEELLVEVGKNYSLTEDPEGRATCGLSSGAICAFTMAWERPDAFRKVASFYGSYTSIGFRQDEEGNVTALGGDSYPTLIRRLAAGSRGPNGRPPEIKPLKIFFQDGSNDLNNLFGSWWLANQRMVSALEWANAEADRREWEGPRYQVKYEWGDGGHTSNHGAAILPDILRWLWDDYRPSDRLSGKWKAEFETQVGRQPYTFTFKRTGEELVATAEAELNNQKRQIEFTDVRATSDTISFVELLNFAGNPIRIEFEGRLTEDGLTLTRQVGDFASEQATAQRVATESTDVGGASEIDRPAQDEPGSRPQANSSARRGAAGRRGGFGGPITLGPDDKPAFEDPPLGFDQARDSIAHGQLEMVEYDSSTVGTRRKALVYTPPGYSNDQKYPVLYLLHGIGGDEEEWRRGGHPEIILDNLIADRDAVPMIVVMPNGRAQKNDRAEGNVMASAPAFAKFEDDLLHDLIPFIESQYPVEKDRDSRALAGLSMGGGQSLNFGLRHLDTFAWVGGFSSAPNTDPPADLVPNPTHAAEQLKLLFISCGNKDGLIRISQGVHAYLKENAVPHIWHVDEHAHDFDHWKKALYHFAQRIF